MKILIIILIFLFNSKILFSKSLFETNYYEIQFESNNVQDTKLEKIKEIKFKSFKNIFENILNQNDFNKINKNINEDLINTFIKSLSFEDEQIILNNYYSKLKIDYDTRKIIQYLRSKELSYVEYLPSNFITLTIRDIKPPITPIIANVDICSS